jgi:hypothetical protein
MNDSRNIVTGHVIPTQNYADQPYVVVLPDESWLCVLTTGAGREGQPGQHVVALRSFNQGKSWETPVPIEPADGPEASWVVPLLVPNLGGKLGRVYAFYVYNGDNRRTVIFDSGKELVRVDTLGHYVFRYSDDGGATWSEQRTEIPVREFDIDRENPYKGETRFFWSVCKPLTVGNRVYLAVHKVGRFGDGFMARSEGAFLASDNILHESDPTKVLWETLPDGDIGLRPVEKAVADEQNITALSDGTLFCTYRTVEGHPCHAYSRDGGHSWTPPAHMIYGPGQRKVKHPRAANFVRRFSNCKFLYWFHNHGLQWYEGRNPAWLIGGEEITTPEGQMIQWSQPEIALYDDGIGTRMSYPDFIEQNGQFFLTETQKSIARSHQVAPELLDALWNSKNQTEVSQNGLAAQRSGAGTLEMPTLPQLWRERGGFSIDFKVLFENLTPHQMIFDSRNERGHGITIMLTDRGTLKLTLCSNFDTASGDNGSGESSWECDPGLITAGKWHSVTAIVDAGPKVILWVIDGQLNDGGSERPFGWGYFYPHLNDLNAAPTAQVAPSLRGEISELRVYNRALYVNEAAANHRAANNSTG